MVCTGAQRVRIRTCSPGPGSYRGSPFPDSGSTRDFALEKEGFTQDQSAERFPGLSAQDVRGMGRRTQVCAQIRMCGTQSCTGHCGRRFSHSVHVARFTCGLGIWHRRRYGRTLCDALRVHHIGMHSVCVTLRCTPGDAPRVHPDVMNTGFIHKTQSLLHPT